MTKLNYSSIAALIADFKAGTKFEIAGSSIGNNGPVIKMVAEGRRVRATVARPDRSDGCGSQTFDRTGEGVSGIRLVQVAGAPAPFLKRLVLGESAYCPKTREVVEAVVFRTNALEVVLRNEDGITRVSTSYDHEGKHKWIKERSLVLGDLPALPKPTTYTVDDLFMTSPKGVYTVTRYGKTYLAVVRQTFSRRTVTFVSDTHMEPLNREAWIGAKFTLTDKKLTFA